MSIYNDQSGDSARSDVTPWNRWQDWINMALGAWLFLAPWFWAGTSQAVMTARSNAWIMAVIIFVMALWALSAPKLTLPEWINAIAGVWLFISPWALGFAFHSAGAWNHWIVGLVVFFLSISAARLASGPTSFPGRPVTGS